MARVRRGQVDPSCYDDEQQRDELPIVSGENVYGGRGAKLTAIVVDGDRAWFNEAALHGRTAIEQTVTWAKSPDEVPAGRTVNPVWVYIRPASRRKLSVLRTRGRIDDHRRGQRRRLQESR